MNLTLKVGCIASVMWNLSIEDGLVKSARVQVVDDFDTIPLICSFTVTVGKFPPLNPGRKHVKAEKGGSRGGGLW
jgi:hypothetical protein